MVFNDRRPAGPTTDMKQESVAVEALYVSVCQRVVSGHRGLISLVVVCFCNQAALRSVRLSGKSDFAAPRQSHGQSESAQGKTKYKKRNLKKRKISVDGTRQSREVELCVFSRAA